MARGSSFASASYRDTGVVLRTYPLGEADRIVVLRLGEVVEQTARTRSIAVTSASSAGRSTLVEASEKPRAETLVGGAGSDVSEIGAGALRLLGAPIEMRMIPVRPIRPAAITPGDGVFMICSLLRPR